MSHRGKRIGGGRDVKALGFESGQQPGRFSGSGPAHGLILLRFDSARWRKTTPRLGAWEKSHERFGAGRPARKRNLKEAL